MTLTLLRNGEIAGGLVCGCMPAIPQFFRHFVPKIKSVFSSYYTNTKNNPSTGPNAFSSAKASSNSKHRKIPDPYDDSCNLTGNYDMDSLATPTTQTDKTDVTLTTKEYTQTTSDLESGTRR